MSIDNTKLVAKIFSQDINDKCKCSHSLGHHYHSFIIIGGIDKPTYCSLCDCKQYQLGESMKYDNITI
jgi:hypothetical protein